MLFNRLFCGFPILLGIFALINNVNANSDDLLKRILSSVNNPLVVYMQPGQPTKHLHDHNAKGKVKISTYWLDYLLRATEDDRYDDDADDDLTRGALRSTSCSALRSCGRKCPPKQKTCNTACKQVFDKRNECDEPPPLDICKKNLCGRTMPPYW